MALPPTMARFNRHVTNRITRPLAGKLPGFAIVIHTGRWSGRIYQTPVNAFRDGGDYIIALTYGPDTDWVRNVLAAGGAEIVTRGQRIRLINPRVSTDTAVRWAPLPVGLALRLFGVPQYMRLTRVAGSAAAGPSQLEPGSAATAREGDSHHAMRRT